MNAQKRILLIVVASAVVFGGLGYFLAKGKYSSKEKSNEETTATSAQTSTADTAAADSTSSTKKSEANTSTTASPTPAVKVFTNTYFSIEYPGDYGANDTGYTSGNGLLASATFESPEKPYGAADPSGSFNVTVHDWRIFLGRLAYAKNYKEFIDHQAQGKTLTTTTLDGSEGYLITSANGNKTSLTIYVLKGDELYTITREYKTADTARAEIYAKMVQSFKFVK